MLIGICSSVPQSGKSTIARHLEKTHGFWPAPLADPLKGMVRQFLTLAGYDASELDSLMTHFKNVPLELVRGKPTIRHLCQTIGTEWGRSCIHPDVWVDLWDQRQQKLRLHGYSVIVDDVRRANEAEAIRAAGGELWRVERTVAQQEADPEVLEHASEGELNDWVCNHYIQNDGSLEQLHARIDVLLEGQREVVRA